MRRTVCEAAELLRVSERTILTWIASGELVAIDVSRKRGGRPSWRISAAAIEAFEQSRTTAPQAPRAQRRRKPEGVIEFYK